MVRLVTLGIYQLCFLKYFAYFTQLSLQLCFYVIFGLEVLAIMQKSSLSQNCFRLAVIFFRTICALAVFTSCVYVFAEEPSVAEAPSEATSEQTAAAASSNGEKESVFKVAISLAAKSGAKMPIEILKEGGGTAAKNYLEQFARTILGRETE